MIKFETAPQRLRGIPESPYRHMVRQENARALKLSRAMHMDLGGYACDEHPDQDNIATLTVEEDGRITLRKDFCCPHFERQVQFGAIRRSSKRITSKKRTSSRLTA